MAAARAVRNPGRTVRNNLPEIAGGSVGIGAPLALRETVDVRAGQPMPLLGEPGSMLARWTRPSVAWGVGVGSLTGLLWWRDVGGRAFQDFSLAHAVTGIPTGVGSALLPKQTAAASGEEQRFLSDVRGMVSGSANDGEFAPAGGTSPETQPAQ